MAVVRVHDGRDCDGRGRDAHAHAHAHAHDCDARGHDGHGVRAGAGAGPSVQKFVTGFVTHLKSRHRLNGIPTKLADEQRLLFP